MKAEIRTAAAADIERLLTYDRHISPEEPENIVGLGRVYILEAENSFAGWLRYGLFRDNIPFMNMLYILNEYRGKGFGGAMVNYWEQEMAEQGFSEAMTSTASDEYAQHFYRHLGYKTIGGFSPAGDPFELILAKDIRK